MGRVTRYHYNRQDQLVEEYHFTYDAEGRRLSYTGMDGVSNEYELDAMGLPVHVRLAVDTDLESLYQPQPRRTPSLAGGMGTVGAFALDTYKQDIKDMLPSWFKKNTPTKPVKFEE